MTLCAWHGEPFFGRMRNAQMVLNGCGRIAQLEWHRSAGMREEMRLDAFVVMPNHIHGIVLLCNDVVGAHGRAPLQASPSPVQRSPRSLGSLVAGYKSAVTKRANRMRRSPGVPLWQRNYYEHVIRDEKALNRIRSYIATKPLRWDLDRENPKRTGRDDSDTWLDECAGGPLHPKRRLRL